MPETAHPNLRRLCATGLALVFLIPAILLAGEAQAADKHRPDGIEAVPDVPESARAGGAVEEGNPRVVARLITDADEALSEGDSLRVGVHFEIDPDWHIYWRNSGDAGMATRIDWSAPGLRFGDLQWPAPHVYEQGRGEISTFGYAREVVLFSEATVEHAAESVTLTAEVSYLACKIDCIPGSATLTRTVPTGEADADGREATLAQRYFDEFASRVPVEPGDLGIAADVVYSQRPIRPGDTFRTAIGLNTCAEGPQSCGSWRVVREAERWALIPDTTAQVDFKTAQVTDHPKAPAGQVIRLDSQASPNAPKSDERFSGVVHLENDDGRRTAILIDAPVPRAKSDAATESITDPLLDVGGAADGSQPSESASASAAESQSNRSKPIGFAQALLFALLGGLILNLMPCVFPVLALKVSAFTQLVHEDRRHVMAHGAAYTGGIVGSMLVLAAVVLGLRAVGTEVGWGFQFQNPVFPAVLSGFLVLFALNLFGVFEVNVSPAELADATEERSGLSRSFGEGILAVVLATPCSAPFLGTAVGFALASGPLIILTIFAALGFGLALPFVVLTLVPGWSKVLPKPGPWMEHLKHVLGFTLVGAAIWLTWIVGRSAGVDAMGQVLIFLGVVALAGWLIGVVQTRSRRARWIGTLTAVALVVGVGVPTLNIESSSRAPREADASAGRIDWSSWSDETVQSHLEKGRPVFVDFTADWCITCKVNERTVLSTDTVVSAFRDHDVATLKADWTDGDETIRKKLASFGKAGVPMYLMYTPGQPDDPRVLPEVLTPQLVATAVRDASDNAPN